jgi:predicted house-cleaning noncanonical NTP pyrophosphatase (MazG superfamily)
MRQILENTSEYGISMFHVVSDFKAAYDTIRRNKLLEALKEFTTPQKLERLVQ